MSGKCQSAGAGDAGTYPDLAQLLAGPGQQERESLLNVGVVPFIIRKNDTLLLHDSDFHCGGADINT